MTMNIVRQLIATLLRKTQSSALELHSGDREPGSLITLEDVASAPDVFVLEEIEMRGLLRQLHRQHITHEGTSGPVVHTLLARIKAHLPKEKYDEFLINA